MKTDYIGVVRASWMVGNHREAKIEFVRHDKATGLRRSECLPVILTANVGLNVENGDKYVIELRKADSDGDDEPSK